MRHRKKVKKLNRTASHRKATLANLATQVFLYKRIRTTKAKAKAASSLVERLITFSKKGTLAARRRVLQIVRDKDVVKELFDEIAPNYADRNGGYTRIIKLGQRQGDGAELVYLELVGFEGVKKQKKEKKESKKKETTPEKTAEEQPVESEE